MWINKLKGTSIAIFCLVSSLWSEAQCMDNQPDMFEPSTVNRTAKMKSSQNDIDDLAFEPGSTNFINLDASASSWASYLISPVKTTLLMARKFISFSHYNHNDAMYIGLALSYQFTAAAAYCACSCFSASPQHALESFVMANDTGCAAYCQSLNPLLNYWNCLPVNKI